MQPNLYIKADFTHLSLSYKDMLKLCREQASIQDSFLTKSERMDIQEYRHEFSLKKGTQERSEDPADYSLRYYGMNEYDGEVFSVSNSLDVLLIK